jgi:hypothetical protein
MKHFQLLVVMLLSVLVFEVGMIALRMPIPAARAADSPVPVVITQPGIGECPSFHSCANIYSGGLGVYPIR